MESSALLLFSSNTIYIFVTCALVSVLVLLCEINYGFLIGIQQKTDKKNNLKNPAPGPRGLPIIGNLQEMDGYEVPYQAFGELAKRFGPIIRLQLGSIPTIVVNGIENIKEVLIHRGTHFDSRPNFRRYHQLFAGDKENCKFILTKKKNIQIFNGFFCFKIKIALAFCDWSDVQKARRDMLIPHTFPRNFSQRFDKLNDIVFDQMHTMVGDLKLRSVGEVEIKPVLLETCANIFTQFFASKNFENSDVKFQKMIKSFDKIFYEVNQGYAADFLPFLLPLHQRNFKRLENWSHGIRDFILENIVEDRFETKTDEYEEDYVDSLINHVKNDVKPSIEWDTALFALEDIIGGHSAVGNFLVKVFGFIVQNPNVQIKIQEEIDLTLNDRTTGSLTLGDRSKMVYTEAVIMECLRLIASPIVPHVANQDSTIAGNFNFFFKFKLNSNKFYY